MSFGVYIHIPYCVKKCPYCDFNSWGVGGSFPEAEYTNSVLGELEFYRSDIQGRSLSSIFFGGGTPSLFEPGSVERIISRIYEMTLPSEDVEVSLEVNPKTAALEKLRGFLCAGVNRISIGVQSFNQRKLKFLGRINGPEDGRGILVEVAAAGYENYNLDLIYGTGVETLDDWGLDLEEAVRYGSTHISAYCLTIENGTAFGNLDRKGKLSLPDEDTLSGFIGYTTEFLGDAGYRQYEISNYSRPGKECRHNLLYWRGENYLGVGAGAHSHMKTRESGWGKRWANIKNPSSYMSAVRGGKKPLDFTEELGREEALMDRIIMGFRLNEGLDLGDLKSRYGVIPDEGYIESLMEDGFIEFSGDVIRFTRKGALLADEIIVRFVGSLQ
jgi:oxygen-independent coproporphyrinogen-3 oxidase